MRDFRQDHKLFQNLSFATNVLEDAAPVHLTDYHHNLFAEDGHSTQEIQAKNRQCISTTVSW